VSNLSPSDDRVRRTLAYHERTKHHLRRYARSLGYLDWATQPEPFRTFRGAPRVELPLLADAIVAPYADLFVPGAIKPRRADLNTIAILFELSLGLSAWKELKKAQTRWALRCNPSSGNLHPTEGYAILPALPSLDAGVYHYVSRDHCLERRCAFSGAAAAALAAALPPGAFLLGLSSIHWRESWKYGERAFRYCQHDAGHAIAAVRYAAASLGWTGLLLDHLPDTDVAALLGLDGKDAFARVDPLDREHSDALLLIAPTRPVSRIQLPTVEVLRDSTWMGQANSLSSSHVNWEVIEEVAEATWKPATSPTAVEIPPLPELSRSSTVAAATLIRQRRSCLGLDGQTSIAADTFYIMLDHLLPRRDVPPWDALPWQPHLHLGLFVHRVRDLPPGLYVLQRDATVHDRLRAALRETFRWTRPPGCPDHLRLFLLGRSDLRETARVMSCHQEIASDGAFSLGMIADFEDSIRTRGAWWYRRLFWEAGVLGQALYLEAEAAGIRSTGIGCYFDEVCHELLGLAGTTFQDLYHFTVGGPVDDPRLTTIPPYAHLQRGTEPI
jgi:SagB-type dehydrogenase family enzyme